MKRSKNRILTTHAGSLPRPDSLIQQGASLLSKGRQTWSQLTGSAVTEVVMKQQEFGIDIVNDGEYGNFTSSSIDYGAWTTYFYDRVSGWEPAPPGWPTIAPRREWRLFPGTYRDMPDGDRGKNSPTPPLFTGPIRYTGQEAVQADIANLRTATEALGIDEAFISAVSVGSFARRENRYYATEEEYLLALADAMREEYLAITDAGFLVQLDEPGLASWWDMIDPEPTLEEYKKHAMVRVEAINHALRGVPADRVRFHVCWGSWHGPHITDIPLKDIVDLLLRVEAGAYSVEAGNVRHEHEWKVWRDAKLPDGKLVIPGVVSHATGVVEHPEVVADRILRYAAVIGRENVIAGTDCGLGGRLHPEVAWAKLRALSEGTELATKQLWGRHGRANSAKPVDIVTVDKPDVEKFS
jgi:5-methyltetrahydropteroyltriglutamate--homocysteine methyltransferase